MLALALVLGVLVFAAVVVDHCRDKSRQIDRDTNHILADHDREES